MTFSRTITDHEELVVVIPDRARRALAELLGRLSLDDKTQRGLTREQCEDINRFYHTLF